ncbi:hypothetical protein ACVWYF_001214 [Hymenobacter sp. UYAg731]
MAREMLRLRGRQMSMTFLIQCNQSPAEFAFLKSSLTLQPQTNPTMLQTRYFFGYYYFYATA